MDPAILPRPQLTAIIGQRYSLEPNSQYMDDSDMVLPLEGGAELEIIETGDNNGDTNGNSVIAQLNYGK